MGEPGLLVKFLDFKYSNNIPLKNFSTIRPWISMQFKLALPVIFMGNIKFICLLFFKYGDSEMLDKTIDNKVYDTNYNKVNATSNALNVKSKGPPIFKV